MKLWIVGLIAEEGVEQGTDYHASAPYIVRAETTDDARKLALEFFAVREANRDPRPYERYAADIAAGWVIEELAPDGDAAVLYRFSSRD